VIRLDPKNAFAFRVPAWQISSAVRPPRRVHNLDQASALDPKIIYSALWLDIITTRNNLFEPPFATRLAG
jgi:hypothetical protein